MALTSPKIDEKLVCLQMVARCERAEGQLLVLIGDKHFRGKQFETDLAALDATILRPRRKDEKTIATTPSRQPRRCARHRRSRHNRTVTPRPASRISPRSDNGSNRSSGSSKTSSRSNVSARTLNHLRVRLCARFAALAAAIMLNHQLDRPSRSLVNYTA